MSFHIFRVFTFAVAETQAGERKPCVSFHGATLLQMVADLQKPRKFNPAKVKAYIVFHTQTYSLAASPYFVISCSS